MKWTKLFKKETKTFRGTIKKYFQDGTFDISVEANNKMDAVQKYIKMIPDDCYIIEVVCVEG